MKKKFFAMYALAGALVASPVFTSCVDSEESASVTELRGAKAEQLKAAATLAQAQAAAETIKAEAQAAYQKAQAAYYQAQADEKVQNMEQAAQKFAVEIETIKLRAEQELLSLQKQIEEAKNDLADAEYDRFNEVYWQYQNELSTLTDLKNDLLDKQAKLALLEANVISTDAWNEYFSIQAQNDIASYKAKLAVYQENKDLDNATLRTKADSVYIEATLGQKNFAAGEEPGKLVAANELVQEKNEAAGEVMEIINTINNSGWSIVSYDWDSVEARINSNKGLSNSWWTNWYYYYKNIRISETEKLNATRYYANIVENYATVLGKADDTKDKTTAYGVLAKANADLTAAQALAETTDAEKAAKKQAIADAETAIAQAKDALAVAQKDYDNAVADQTEFNEKLAALDVDAANKLAEEMVAANDANEEAWKVWKEAYEAVDEMWDEYYALNDLAWNAGENISEQIAQLEANIASREADLISYQRNTAEETLAQAKEEIAQLEAKIELKEKVVAERKAALDALLAEEETPAE